MYDDVVSGGLSKCAVIDAGMRQAIYHRHGSSCRNFFHGIALFHMVYLMLPAENLPLLIISVIICREAMTRAFFDYLSAFVCYVTDSVRLIIDLQ
jgi:hypothetical protein